MTFTNDMYKKRMAKLFAALALTAAVSSCSDDFTAPELPTGQTIYALASANADLNIFTAAVNQTGLSTSLNNNNSGQFTVFAPTDDAFLTYLRGVYSDPSLTEEGAIAKLKTLTTTSTPLSVGTLASRLTYHLVSSDIKSSMMTDPMTFTTINGGRLSLTKQGTDLLLNGNTGASGAKSVTLDTEASNGVLFTISNVLLVPTATNILSPLSMSVSYTTATPTVTGGLETGGDTNANDFDILAYAVRRGNLATTLVPNQSPLPDLTVFAPIDFALLAYLEKTTEAEAILAIKAMDATAVADLVKKHIVAGRYVSSDLINGLSIPTLKASTNIHIALEGVVIHVNSTTGPAILTPNTLTGNGVFHVIDHVIDID